MVELHLSLLASQKTTCSWETSCVHVWIGRMEQVSRENAQFSDVTQVTHEIIIGYVVARPLRLTISLLDFSYQVARFRDAHRRLSSARTAPYSSRLDERSFSITDSAVSRLAFSLSRFY